MKNRFMLMGKLIIDEKCIGKCEAFFNGPPSDYSGKIELVYVSVGDDKLSKEMLDKLGDDIELQLEYIVKAKGTKE